MQHFALRSGAFVVLLIVVCALPCRAQETGAKAVDAAWVKAMKANDLDAVMRCYAPDAVAWLPGAPMARGEKAIRSAYEGLLSANIVKDIALSEAEYKTMGDTSVAWGRFSLTLISKSGGNTVVMTGRFTEFAEQRSGRWVYIVDHASADPAATKDAEQ